MENLVVYNGMASCELYSDATFIQYLYCHKNLPQGLLVQKLIKKVNFPMIIVEYMMYLDGKRHFEESMKNRNS